MSSKSSEFRGLQTRSNPLAPEPESSFSWLESHKDDGCSLQARKNTSHEYVSPVMKRSPPSVSHRSLEMCTDTLGSETGCSIDPNLEEYAYLVLGKQSCNITKQQKTPEFRKKVKYDSVFPPPLSSISGGNGVRVEARREGDQLVITASSFCADRMFFKSERENGRLRLFVELDKKPEKDGGKIGELCSRSRCDGVGSMSKKLSSLPVCVTAFS